MQCHRSSCCCPPVHTVSQHQQHLQDTGTELRLQLDTTQRCMKRSRLQPCAFSCSTPCCCPALSKLNTQILLTRCRLCWEGIASLSDCCIAQLQLDRRFTHSSYRAHVLASSTFQFYPLIAAPGCCQVSMSAPPSLAAACAAAANCSRQFTLPSPSSQPRTDWGQHAAVHCSKSLPLLGGAPLSLLPMCCCSWTSRSC